MRIEPSIARNLWFFPPIGNGRHADGQPFAAILAGVNDDGTINLLVAARDGSPYGVQNVPLLQDGDPIDQDTAHAVWMPYQKGQAAKTETAEGGLAPRLAALEDVLKTDGPFHTLFTDLETSVAKRFTETGEYLDKKFAALAGNPAPAPQQGGDAPAPGAGDQAPADPNAPGAAPQPAA